MTALVRERSKIAAKGQTTVPKAIRQALGVSYGGEIDFVVDEGGRVSLLAAETEADPVIDGFLMFLAQDNARNPQHITAFPTDLAARMTALTVGTTVDLDEEIDEAVTLRAMVIDGWTIFAHPLLLDQLERATAAVEKAAAADPEGHRRTAQAKLLAMLRTLIFETIPTDPTRPE
ncbi:hypothetical protein G4G93_06865 [Methylobacterium sp. DB0501]|nr:hypothetical protein [Methylobacterium sp. DB0501]